MATVQTEKQIQEELEALEAARPDPPDLEHQGGALSLEEHVTKDARSDILNPHFPFQSKTSS